MVRFKWNGSPPFPPLPPGAYGNLKVGGKGGKGALFSFHCQKKHSKIFLRFFFSLSLLIDVVHFDCPIFK